MSYLTKFTKKSTCCLITYHRIVDDDTVFLPKGDVVHHHIRDFEKEMAFLKKYFKVISLDEMTFSLKNSISNGPYACILFDDGHRDNYTHAYPVLKKLRIPAIIYLTTGLVGTNELLWTDQIEHLLLKTRKKFVEVPGLKEGKINISSYEDKIITNNQLTSYLKTLPNSRRIELIAQLKLELEVDLTSDTPTMLSWDEVRQMHADGILFGAHTMTHPILTQMPLEQAKEEIKSSKETVERQLGTKVRHFAIPNGEDTDFSDKLRQYCMEIGLETIATANWGFVKKISDLTAMKRVGVVTPLHQFASKLIVNIIRK